MLIERTKLLVGIAQQIEAQNLAAIEKFDVETYTLLRAQNDLKLANAGITLQYLRLNEAQSGVSLGISQQVKTGFQAHRYQNLMTRGVSELEVASVALLGTAAAVQVVAAGVSYLSSFMPASVSATGVSLYARGYSCTPWAEREKASAGEGLESGGLCRPRRHPPHLCQRYRTRRAESDHYRSGEAGEAARGEGGDAAGGLNLEPSQPRFFEA